MTLTALATEADVLALILLSLIPKSQQANVHAFPFEGSVPSEHHDYGAPLLEPPSPYGFFISIMLKKYLRIHLLYLHYAGCRKPLLARLLSPEVKPDGAQQTLFSPFLFQHGHPQQSIFCQLPYEGDQRK